MRAIICGASGAGKTSFLLNLITQLGIFNRLIFIVKNPDEKLYKYAAQKLGKFGDHFMISNQLKDIPDRSTFDPKECSILVIDDMILEAKKNPDHKRVEEMFVYSSWISTYINKMESEEQTNLAKFEAEARMSTQNGNMWISLQKEHANYTVSAQHCEILDQFKAQTF